MPLPLEVSAWRRRRYEIKRYCAALESAILTGSPDQEQAIPGDTDTGSPVTLYNFISFCRERGAQRGATRITKQPRRQSPYYWAGFIIQGQHDRVTLMHKNWVMSQESFEGLLEWLDSDRDRAGIKYEQIRTGLIKFFNCRTHCAAEDLADETINRVIGRLHEVKIQVTGERTRYFFGVARKVQMEYLRRKTPQAPPDSVADSRRVEAEYRCLEECIAKLSAENRELVLGYYAADGREKIEQRKLLAEKLGIAPNALRIRAYRIRAALQKCLERCVEDSLQ